MMDYNIKCDTYKLAAVHNSVTVSTPMNKYITAITSIVTVTYQLHSWNED